MFENDNLENIFPGKTKAKRKGKKTKLWSMSFSIPKTKIVLRKICMGEQHCNLSLYLIFVHLFHNEMYSLHQPKTVALCIRHPDTQIIKCIWFSTLFIIA